MTVAPHHKDRHAAFAADLTGASRIYSLRIWWDAILRYGPLLGYFAKPSKSWLIVKDEHLEQAKVAFGGLGSEQHKTSYVKKKVSRWVRELEVL